MATTVKFRKIQQIASASVTPAYTVAPSVTSAISKIKFTNTTTTPLVLDISQNDGVSDLLIERIQLPGGVGQSRNYYDLERSVFAAGDILNVDPDGATAFNMFIYGSETSE